MKFNETASWFKKKHSSFLLIAAALILVVLVALLSTALTNQDNTSTIFVINLLSELFGALIVALIAGVVYQVFFAKAIVEQLSVHQEKSMSNVGRHIYQLEETTSEISRSKARMIELLDEGISITNEEKNELHQTLERIPVLVEEAVNLHFEYLAEIGKDVPTLEIQKNQYLRKKDQDEKFLSAGFLLESAFQKNEYGSILSTLNRWAKEYPEIYLYVAQVRARLGNYQKAIDGLKNVINDEQAYKYCIDHGQGQKIIDLYKVCQAQLDVVHLLNIQQSGT